MEWQVLKSVCTNALAFNSRTRGIPVLFVGAFVILSSLVLSQGYIAQRGFFGSLPYMNIEVTETYYLNIKTGEKEQVVLFRQPHIIKRTGVSIPTRYLVVLGLFIALGGPALAFASSSR
ncbi:MAG: hypothetical protein HYV18_04110 [Gammaproteobacteria bacterium]|nr:hypothetical protein [Gammaproteobacteria bacterium]